MTYKENAENIGKEGTVQLGGLTVKVKILDYKFSYGRDRWLVEPIAGKGQVWTEAVHI